MIVNPHDLHSTASSDKLTFERVLISFSRSFIEQGDAGVAKRSITGRPGSFAFR